MDDLEAQLQIQTNEYLQYIQGRIKELFRNAIQIGIYDYYEPNIYHRYFTFLNSVKTHLDLATGTIYVYVDLNEGSNYYSAVDGSSQFENIAHWIESGHSDGIGDASKGYNQYHQFEGRRYLEKAKQLINAEFPEFQIEILHSDDYM